MRSTPPRTPAAIASSHSPPSGRRWQRQSRSPSRTEPSHPADFPATPRARRHARYLFNLGFLEDDVLARNGIELLQLELVGLRSRVLFRDVEKPRIGAADQLDEDSARLCHRWPLGVRR